MKNDEEIKAFMKDFGINYTVTNSSENFDLIIFISHADGKNPAGRSAKSVMYDASLKIYIEGYRAFSKGKIYW